jgi:hypothetical protein
MHLHKRNETHGVGSRSRKSRRPSAAHGQLSCRPCYSSRGGGEQCSQRWPGEASHGGLSTGSDTLAGTSGGGQGCRRGGTPFRRACSRFLKSDPGRLCGRRDILFSFREFGGGEPARGPSAKPQDRPTVLAAREVPRPGKKKHFLVSPPNLYLLASAESGCGSGESSNFHQRLGVAVRHTQNGVCAQQPRDLQGCGMR